MLNSDRLHGLAQDWIVMMREGTTDEDLGAVCAKHACKFRGHPGEGGVPFVVVHGSKSDLQALLGDAGGRAEFVEPSARVSLIPDDEDRGESDDMEALSMPWGLDRIGGATRPSEGKGVNVYIMDTGIRASHVDFGGRVIPALDMTGGSTQECKGDLGCAADRRGHGTHCAGSAAGKTYGVASQATIRTVKVLGDDGSGDWSWIIGGFDWSASRAIKPGVLSASLGGPGIDTAVGRAVEAAVQSGLTVLVAGGNAGKDACDYTPAHVPSAITVGATNFVTGKAFFTNSGPCINIWAPGTDITSASHTSDTGKTDKSGTSMSCPYVAGGAALLLEANPGMRAAQVLAALHENAMTDHIVNMKPDEINKLLWVGAGDAPPPTPAPCRRRLFCR
jgi:subtilisin family serine protease